jgi:hypothetical protein
MIRRRAVAIGGIAAMLGVALATSGQVSNPVIFLGEVTAGFPANAVLFNNGGAAGGSSAFTFVSATGTVGLNSTGGDTGVIDLNKTWTDLTTAQPASINNFNLLDPVADTTKKFYVLANELDTAASAINYPAGLRVTSSQFFHLGTGTIAEIVVNYNNFDNSSTGVITSAYNNYSLFSHNFGTVGTFYDYYGNGTAGDPGSGVANAYFLWNDTAGVFRAKSDSTVDSGQTQTILTTYNPRFTKYTPGAANFERLILGQWISNVVELGTEAGAGGGNVLRNLRLKGAAIQLGADTILENGNALKTDTTTAHTALLQAYDVEDVRHPDERQHAIVRAGSALRRHVKWHLHHPYGLGTADGRDGLRHHWGHPTQRHDERDRDALSGRRRRDLDDEAADHGRDERLLADDRRIGEHDLDEHLRRERGEHGPQ